MPRTLRSLFAVIFSLGILSAAIAWQNTGGPIESPTEKIPVLVKGPAFWKGNLHTHSLWSDGDDFPEMIADWYKRHGYHFLTLSDHKPTYMMTGKEWYVRAKVTSRKLHPYQKGDVEIAWTQPMVP